MVLRFDRLLARAEAAYESGGLAAALQS
jgi:hypothetical protein